MACGLLVPVSGIEPMPTAVEAQSLNFWEVLYFFNFCLYEMAVH